jgi:hypothetical protein
MPRGEPRRLIAFRLSESGHTWLRDLATTEGVPYTTVYRAVMAVARRHEAETKTVIREIKEQN